MGIVNEEDQQDAKPPSGTETQIDSYTFQTAAAKKFADQLKGGGDMAREELTALMGEVEQVHNATQNKLSEQSLDDTDTALEQSVRELSVIHKAVEQRLHKNMNAEAEAEAENEQNSANMKTGKT